MGADARTITAEDFDRRADLLPDDPAGDLESYIDHTKTRRPGREVQRVNVDFPIDLLAAIDREAQRMGVTRQAFIKLRLADTLRPTAPGLMDRLKEAVAELRATHDAQQARIDAMIAANTEVLARKTK